jgi:hypothetical protein
MGSYEMTTETWNKGVKLQDDINRIKYQIKQASYVNSNLMLPQISIEDLNATIRARLDITLIDLENQFAAL